MKSSRKGNSKSNFASVARSVIRSEKVRRCAPAVRAVGRHYLSASQPELSESWMRRVRNHLGEILRAAKLAYQIERLVEADIILPGAGHKYEEVQNELAAAGVPAGSITYLVRRFRLVDVFGYLRVVFPAAAIRWTILRRLSKNTSSFGNILFQVVWFAKCLRSLKSHRFWLIMGDLSPFLIAFQGATKLAGHKSISWQYGYQDFKPFPVRPELAFILNREGFRLARLNPDAPEIPVFQRVTVEPKSVRFSDRRSGVVGVVLNAFSVSDVMEKIKEIQVQLGCSIVVRPHPNDAFIPSEVADPNIEIRRSGTVKEFSQSVDWSICGNTTTALKLLGSGVPVCQYFALDRFFEDHFQYGLMGLMPVFSDASTMSEDALRQFYADHKPPPGLLELLGHTSMSAAHSISEFKHWLDLK